MIANYHTHHQLCRHATGTIEDYTIEAIKHGFKELGMSDHAPFKWMNDPRRMTAAEFNDYITEFHTIKMKYKDQISLKSALESEYFAPLEHTYPTTLKRLDYLILGQHYIYYDDDLNHLESAFDLTTHTQIRRYGDIVVKALKTGYFKILAHPDVYLTGFKEFNKTAKEVAYRICQAAKETNTLLEWNANGYRKAQINTSLGKRYVYPRPEFFQIAKELGCLTILSSDCHAPNLLYDDAMRQAEADYNAFGLKTVSMI
jgi:histidinol-phosphatase (PHP family)